MSTDIKLGVKELRKGKWGQVLMSYEAKTYRKGWRGVWDHFLDVWNKERMNFVYDDLTMSAWVQLDKDATVFMDGIQVESNP